MNKNFSAIFKWLTRQALALLLILAVLLAGAWLKGELKRAGDLESDRAVLTAQLDELARQIGEQKRNAEARSRQAVSVLRNIGSMLTQAQAERQKLWEEHFWARKVPLSEIWIEIQLLDKAIASHEELRDREARFVESRTRELNTLLMQKQHQAEQIKSQIAGVEEKLGKAFITRLANVVIQQLPAALAVLAGIILLPTGIKAFFYFVVAPWATGRPPIRLLPSALGGIRSRSVEGSAEHGNGKMSAVSQAIVLAEHQELLIQPDYLQSTSLRAEKSTRYLLNASIPFSSLLSGMFLLTRIGPAGSEPVVISATKDPLSEVGIIDLAEGAAFACLPRSLAGVIQNPGKPIRITRHWRLGSLQSWLTLQLRFLVFHGPGQLVLKGCRGIRIEAAGTGRLINQAATLGFSANLDYANTRCETFTSYWSGKEDLFNDLFTGGNGVYVYEEMPDPKHATGIAGRGLEGFADAVLKIFGV